MPFSLTDVTATLALLNPPALDTLQLLDAASLAAQRHPHLDPNAPALVLGLADADIAATLSAALQQVYPAAHPVEILGAARATRPLGQLAAADLPAAFFLPPLSRPASYAALQDIVARLRAPDGCPWDRELTWEKLRPSLLEETYELLAALDAGDFTRIREEQGDLLLQVALQVQIATEEGRFRFGDVSAAIVEKLIRRHPHVFGDVAVSGTDEVLANWEAIKAAERARNGEQRSPLAGVPAGLPALAQAEAYLDRMSRLQPAARSDAPWQPLADLAPDAAVTPDLLGDVLFGLVAWARARGVEPESALRAANARYAAAVAAR